MAKAMGYHANDHLLSILQRENGILDEIREKFAELAQNLLVHQWNGDGKRIVFFFETQKTQVYKQHLPKDLVNSLSKKTPEPMG